MTFNISEQKTVLVIVMITSFFTPFMGSSLNIAVPTIGHEFNSSATLLSWVVTSYILATAACLLPFGRFADIHGRKRVFLSGIIVFSLSALLGGLAPSIGWLIVFRAMQGIGGAMIFSTSLAILTSVYPPERRGKALGLSAAMTYSGLSLGPVLGGLINYYLGWRTIFFLVAPCGLIVAALVIVGLKQEWTGAPGEKFDALGSVLYCSGLVAFLFGMSKVTSDAWAPWLLGSGIFLLIGFVRYELSKSEPLLDVRLFTNNLAFAFSNLAALINYSATFAVGFLTSVHLQVIMGMSSKEAGLVLLSQPLLMALLSPFAGRMSDRVEPRIVATAGMAITGTGLFLFSFVTQETSLISIVVNLAVIGIGFALFASPNSNAIMSTVQRRQYGVAASSLATVRMSGQALSMGIMTLILALYGGHASLAEASPEMLQLSFRVSFLVFTSLCILGVFFSMARGRIREKTL